MPPKSKAKNPVSKQISQLRIIGGEWRSRKLEFPHVEGLRPTPDRVRETLFNWLQTAVPGAHCLDLFAGSGALGLEALSRGASACTFVDIASESCQYLRSNMLRLKSDKAEIIQQDALLWLEQTPTEKAPYDIIFLDPPFNKDFLPKICQLLMDKKIVHSNSYIYFESELSVQLPLQWNIHREKKAGQVYYRLCTLER